MYIQNYTDYYEYIKIQLNLHLFELWRKFRCPIYDDQGLEVSP